MKILGITLQTISEFIGLVIWLAAESGLILDPITGRIILMAGFLAEHFVAYFFLISKDLPKMLLMAVSVSETILWIVWLIIFNVVGIIPTTIFLLISMLVQHTIESHVFGGRAPFTPPFPIDSDVLPHTIVEVVGATAWIYLVQSGTISVVGVIGAVILLVLLAVEHIIQSK